jgi:hypothetical protein
VHKFFLLIIKKYFYVKKQVEKIYIFKFFINKKISDPLAKLAKVHCPKHTSIWKTAALHAWHLLGQENGVRLKG